HDIATQHILAGGQRDALKAAGRNRLGRGGFVRPCRSGHEFATFADDEVDGFSRRFGARHPTLVQRRAIVLVVFAMIVGAVIMVMVIVVMLAVIMIMPMIVMIGGMGLIVMIGIIRVIVFQILGGGAQQGLAVGDRDPVVIRMDFAEGQETVAIA